MPHATTASIRRVPRSTTRPRLDSTGVLGLVAIDIHGRDVLDDFDLAWILAYTAHGERFAVVEGAICYVDIGAVLFHADAVVAAVDCPAKKGYVVRVGCVDAWVEKESVIVVKGNFAYLTVGVDVGAEVSSCFGCVVDVDVL